MKLSEFTKHLNKLKEIIFQLPNGQLVPEHFHVTEVGKISKQFIDCGGTLRHEEKISFQLWEENDYNHRLHPEKLVNIIELAKNKLNLPDAEIEVEYQGESINKFGLDVKEEGFILTNTQTDCLAKEDCGIPVSKPKVKLSQLQNSGCSPKSGCC
ncbi:DUF6428 family protein [Christiangramia forsetii]|uniref:Uncharacterized protein n=2 Tax=Christiangramia forsetii TaxID=411153 RepID=A0M3G7_CHRFK|nr:DUF6428 family protein [Christiangramia forsetii]GGG25900.1 hypothetical protein GCM10011532_06580 [Christiangramia forsetii]CAL67162.1 conserved hypothetical protein [Christiangramia forsetii KT0803]